MAARRPTVADILALKGKRQLAMLRVMTLEEAEAAERAGVEMLSVTPTLMEHPEFRDAAPSAFVFAGLEWGHYATTEDYLRISLAMMKKSADAVYCAASLATVRRLRDEGVPVCGHSGLIPSHSTWTGGFKAVGKTAASAAFVWKQVRDLEAAGAFSAEIEVVPAEIATAISQRTSMYMISMGAGTGCDAQYLFADDVLGQNRGHVPRHAKIYRNFAAEQERLQRERIAAFSEYAADVKSGAYPERKHVVGVARDELAKFVAMLDASTGKD
jgi:3-methyl-2-oxobutanoate hydroxymethyltransferase